MSVAEALIVRELLPPERGRRGERGEPGVKRAQAVTLAPEADATARLDPETGLLTIGVPQGRRGDPGRAGDDGEDGAGVARATATTLAPGADATARFEPDTGLLTVGLPQGRPGASGRDGQSVETVTAHALPPDREPTAVWHREIGRLDLGIPTGARGSAGQAIFGGGGSSLRVRDEGSLLGNASAIDFVGDGVAVSVVKGVATVAVAGASSTPETLDIQLNGWDGSQWIPVLGDPTGRLVVTS